MTIEGSVALVDSIETQGIRLPRLGFGTFRLTGDACRVATESALSLGYRHIDTAEMYGNEDAVGAAIANSGVKRGDLHVTTKVWHDHLAPDAIRHAFDTSLKKLQLDFVDLYLIHWPSKDMDLPRALETLVRLREEGRVRAIGVCNFTLPLLKTAIETVGAPIACNQVEYHTFLDQSVLLKYLGAKGVPWWLTRRSRRARSRTVPNCRRLAASMVCLPRRSRSRGCSTRRTSPLFPRLKARPASRPISMRWR